MEKRFLLAIGLSFAVLMVYSSFFPKTQLVDNKQVTNDSQKNVEQVVKLAELDKASEIKNTESQNSLKENELYNMEIGNLSLKFSKKGAYVFEVFDKEQKFQIGFKRIGLVPEWAEHTFEATEIDKGVIFIYRATDGSEIKKIFRALSDNSIELTISVNNATSSNAVGYSLLSGYCVPSEITDPISQRYYEAAVLTKNIVFRKPIYGLKKSVENEGKITWLGIRDRYFCTIMLPQQTVNKAVTNSLDKGVYLALTISEHSVSGSSLTFEDKYKIYIGPQNERKLKDFGSEAERIINFGMFDPIAKAIFSLLNVSYKVTKNWGWAIILMTTLVYVLMFPLSLKSMLSMKKMQALQPKIEELKSKYKDNAQKLNTEIMELYKREKVNPLGGCLPMLLQIPVFFSLYQLLMRLINLRGAHFLWIKDLSEPDRLVVFGTSLPFLGNELNILPLLMAVGMFVQQKISTPPALDTSSSAAEQQKMMAIVMPIVFGVLFYKMSSGLVLYWFVNNLLTLGFQWKISAKKI